MDKEAWRRMKRNQNGDKHKRGNKIINRINKIHQKRELSRQNKNELKQRKRKILNCKKI